VRIVDAAEQFVCRELTLQNSVKRLLDCCDVGPVKQP